MSWAAELLLHFTGNHLPVKELLFAYALSAGFVLLGGLVNMSEHDQLISTTVGLPLNKKAILSKGGPHRPPKRGAGRDTRKTAGHYCSKGKRSDNHRG